MKERSLFECQSCGHQEPKWLGRCPECGSWNSFTTGQGGSSGSSTLKTSIPLDAVEIKDAMRFTSGDAEVDRVLGGGLMRGASVLIGGEPGIGKSTLMLQLSSRLKTQGRVLYVSGEESAGQIRMRADRLNIAKERIEVLCETELGVILRILDQVKPVLAIVDSVQTVYSADSNSSAGTVSQLKSCAQALNEWAKSHSCSLCLLGHVTKEGFLAGPKVIEHLVDTVLYFDRPTADIRILRALKNRFGSVQEIGIFQMTPTGLRAVLDPASLFLEHRKGDLPGGVAVAPLYEGSRVLLVEIQSLVVPAKGGISRVFSDRIDSRRVSRIGAVLEKQLKLPFSDLDIYVNVAGGMRIEEVGIDLALALALYSARANLSLSAATAVLGEVSLAGEIREVPYIDRRVHSTLDMGFNRLIGPRRRAAEEGSFYQAVETLQEAVRVGFA
jgi:DNA repair protein RadA/Sms